MKYQGYEIVIKVRHYQSLVQKSLLKVEQVILGKLAKDVVKYPQPIFASEIISVFEIALGKNSPNFNFPSFFFEDVGRGLKISKEQ